MIMVSRVHIDTMFPVGANCSYTDGGHMIGLFDHRLICYSVNKVLKKFMRLT